MHSRPAIPGYELFQRLGGGPITQVWAARRLATDERCAIKVPRDDWSGHTDAVRLLRREAGALRSVRHPHVISLIESQTVEPPRFLAMSLIVGESLRHRLQRAYALDLRVALWIARQVAEGLQAIHLTGHVHGDVKPENVLLAESGSAILIDLGFAHRPGDPASLEAEGYVLGTANYLAPERACEPRADGYSADWYSFGVMLSEMLTGELPHEPRTLAGAVSGNGAEPIRRLAPVRDWPPRLQALIDGLLDASPSARPQGRMVEHELIALEIESLRRRRAG